MKCGYFKKDITPPVKCCLSGNAKVRIAEEVADPLFVRAVAFEEDGLAVVLCFDLIGMIQVEALKIREFVAKTIGCDTKQIFLTCTHTHTAPNIHSRFYPKTDYLMTSLKDLAAAAAQGAIADLKEASFFFARSELPGVSFNRRYLMKDGTTKTNPGRRNPNILRPVVPADETIQLLKIVREGADDIALVNFQVHPDVRGGSKISADYPAVVCNTLEGALPNTKCIYFNGASGDLNHVDVNCPEWDKNGGPDHVQHMGRSIAGKILSMYTKARPVATGPVRTAQIDVPVPMRQSSPEELAEAQEFLRLYLEENLKKIANYKTPEDLKDISTPEGFILPPNVNLTSYVYEMLGIVVGAESGPIQMMPVTGLSFGEVSFAGFPGEVFCEIGRQVRETSPYKAQFIMGLTHGYPDYFLTKDAFEVDGYEKRSCPYQAGVGELMMDAGKALVKELFDAASNA